MTPETIHLFALLGVRALADYDPAEFRRTCDLSTRQVDEKIDRLLASAKDTQNHQLVAEAETHLEQLRAIERDADSQTELTFLLRQLSVACLQRAQQTALSYSRTVGPRAREPRMPNRDTSSLGRPHHESPDEYLRLGIMRLLRDLPGYTPVFEYPVRGQEIDCLLEPADSSLPVIFIEGKTSLRSLGVARAAVTQLVVLCLDGEDGDAAVLVSDIVPRLYRDWQDEFEDHLLVYDSEVNEFAKEGGAELVALIRSWGEDER